MKTYSFDVITRPEELKTRGLRKEDRIPGVVYGQGSEAINISCDYIPFWKLYKDAGEYSLIDLTINGKDKQKVMIKNISFDPVKDTVMSVDFYTINMKEKITASIPLNFVGDAPAVKDFGGIFVVKRYELEVECLPSDLIAEIEVDISNLLNLNDTIHIGQVQVPDTLTVMDDESILVASVQAPRVVTEETEEEVEGAETIKGEEGTEAEGSDEGASEGDSEAKTE